MDIFEEDGIFMGMREYLLKTGGSRSGRDEAFELFCCGKRTEAKGHIYGPESRDYYLFVLISSGRGQLMSSPEKLLLSERHLLVMFPDTVTHYITDPSLAWSIRWIGMSGILPGQFCERMGLTPERPVLRIEGQYDAVQEIFDALVTSAGNTGTPALIHTVNLALQLFDAMSETAEDNTAGRLIRILDTLYREPLTIADIAEELHVHPGYLSRACRKIYGITPKAYLLQKKMAHAKALLADSRLSVQEAAAEVGITDPLYFSRIFRASCGMSPTEYIRTARRNEP